jgi:hypothetical protein
MRAANILASSGFETANLASWATFGPDSYSQSGAGVAPDGINYYKIYGQFNGAYHYTGI